MHVYFINFFLYSLLVTNSIRRIFRLLIWNLITHTTSRVLRSPKGKVRSLEGRNVNYQVGIEDPSRWEVKNSQLSFDLVKNTNPTELKYRDNVYH